MEKGDAQSVRLTELSDTELVKLAQSGDEHALETVLLRYKPLVHRKSQPYYMAGGDDDDIVQEGLIGLYSAIMNFNHEKFPLFNVFAGVCIERRIISAVKKAARMKHIPLNSYISLSESVSDDGGIAAEELIDSGRGDNPEKILIDRENLSGLENIINNVLSPLEMKVLLSQLGGDSYRETARKVGRDVKAVDNAMQRIKKKIENIGTHNDDL